MTSFSTTNITHAKISLINLHFYIGANTKNTRLIYEVLLKFVRYFVTIHQPFEQKMFVFLCELKTNNITGSSKQLQSSEILANYIVKMATKHLNLKSFDVEYRALVFSTSNTIRFATNVKKDAYLKYPSGLKHKHLRAGEDCQLDHHCY